MILNFKLENGAFAPKNEHSLDAGYDLISPVDLKIKPKKRGFINTGVCVQATDIPKGFKFEGKIEGTSGNAKKKGLYPIGGIIDQGYRGNIGVVLVNNSFKTIKIKRGDKIAQLIPMIIPIIDKVNIVEEFTDENNDGRDEAGFGSTGIAGEKATTKKRTNKKSTDKKQSTENK